MRTKPANAVIGMIKSVWIMVLSSNYAKIINIVNEKLSTIIYFFNYSTQIIANALQTFST